MAKRLIHVQYGLDKKKKVSGSIVFILSYLEVEFYDCFISNPIHTFTVTPCVLIEIRINHVHGDSRVVI